MIQPQNGATGSFDYDEREDGSLVASQPLWEKVWMDHLPPMDGLALDVIFRFNCRRKMRKRIIKIIK